MTLYTCTVKGRNQEVLVNMIFHSLRLQGICSQCKPFWLLCFRTNTIQDQKCHAICRWHWQKKASEKKNKQTCFKETISWWWTWRWEKTSTTLCTKGYRVSSCFFQGDSLLKPDYTYHPSGPSGLKSWTWEVIDGKPTQEHQRKVGPKRGLANDANPSTISPLSKIHVVS